MDQSYDCARENTRAQSPAAIAAMSAGTILSTPSNTTLGAPAIIIPASQDDRQVMLPRPKELVIRFSRKSDIARVDELMNGRRKAQIDPRGFVKPRTLEQIEKPVKKGCAAIALDENGYIRAFALATHHGGKKKDSIDNRDDFTEVGAVMCDTGGIGLPKVLVNMLAMKQTYDPKVPHRVYSKVDPDNNASNALFARSMQWNRITCGDTAARLYDRAGQSISDRNRLWYSFRDAAQLKAFEVLQKSLDEGALLGKDGSRVPLDTERSSLWSTCHYYEMLAKHEHEA